MFLPGLILFGIVMLLSSIISNNRTEKEIKNYWNNMPAPEYKLTPTGSAIAIVFMVVIALMILASCEAGY